MIERDLTDEDLGAKMGTSRTTVWRWRTEQNRLNPEKIKALATALGCEPEQLWRPPGRPSLDAIARGASDEVLRKAADVVTIIVRSGG